MVTRLISRTAAKGQGKLQTTSCTVRHRDTSIPLCQYSPCPLPQKHVLLSSILGRNPLVVDYVDEETFPVDPPSPSSSSSSSNAARRAEAPPPVRAPAGVAGTVCAVCTEEMAAADAVVRLPCAHWYHHGCIAPWLGIRATCPMCRAELPPREPDDDEESGGEGAGRAKPAPARGAAAGTSAGATAAATATARARREAPYEYLAVAGGVLSG